ATEYSGPPVERLRAAVPGAPGGRQRVPLPPALPRVRGGRRRVRVRLGRRDPPARPAHARLPALQRRRAPHRHPDLRRRPAGHGGRGGAGGRGVRAGLPGHQLRLPGQKGGHAQRRLRLPARPGPGGGDHPGRARRHLHSHHGQDPQRVERGHAQPGGDRPALPGRGRHGAHPARPQPHPDVQRPRQLGRDRGRQGGAGHPRDRQRRRVDRGGREADARPHGVRRHHDRPRLARRALDLPAGARGAGRAPGPRRSGPGGALPHRHRARPPGHRVGERRGEGDGGVPQAPGVVHQGAAERARAAAGALRGDAHRRSGAPAGRVPRADAGGRGV
ncbi:MAG: tRNA-dihydrouridine synthase DusB, partial [uncultured Gemmatimonadetes bacterium]